MMCCRCGGVLHRCPYGRCWCDGYHHDRDGLVLCPGAGGLAWGLRLPYDLSDIGPGYEWYRERDEAMGLDPWAGAV